MKGKPKQLTKPEGMYPQAGPTAPGGMSMANLRLELAEEHGVMMEESRALSWPDLIQRVADERLAREAENKEVLTTLNGRVVDVTTAEQIVNEGGLAVAEENTPHPDPTGASVEDMFPDEPVEIECPDCGSTAVDNECAECGWAAIDEIDADDSDEAIMGRNIREITTANRAAREAVEVDVDVFDPETLFAEMLEARADEETKNPPLFLGIPGIKDYVFDGHAGAGPSASERWMHCTMSLSLSRAFLETLSPNQQREYAGSNTAARQGTTAHSVGEVKANHMLGRIDNDELESTLLELAVEPEEGEAYDDEMDEYVNEYVDLIKSYADERGAEHVLIEARVEAAIPLDNLHEGEVYIIRGSADVIGMPTDDDPTLVVGDLKYGEGIHVDAEANSQAMIYALGALDLLTDDDGNLITDVQSITLIIAQPRLGGIKTWEISLDDLLDWRDDVLSPALTAALYGENQGATYAPSDSACQFCPGRGTCPALTEARFEAAAEAFDAIIEAEHTGEEIEPTGLSDEKLGSLLSQISGLIDLHKSLKAEAQLRLHRGSAVPGYQLVNYSPPRKWKESAQSAIAASRLGLTKAEREALFKPPTLITPKQATLLLGEKAGAIAALYDTPEKKPVVAPEGDRRSKWEGKPPEAMFADESTVEDRERTVEEMFPDE